MPAAAAAGPLARLLRSPTFRLSLAGAAAVVVLGLIALSIGVGPLGSPPSTPGGPASTALNAPAQRHHAQRRPARARRRTPPTPDGEPRRDARGQPRRTRCRRGAPCRRPDRPRPSAAEHPPSRRYPQALDRRASSQAVAPGHTDAGPAAGHRRHHVRRCARPRCARSTPAAPTVVASAPAPTRRRRRTDTGPRAPTTAGHDGAPMAAETPAARSVRPAPGSTDGQGGPGRRPDPGGQVRPRPRTRPRRPRRTSSRGRRRPHPRTRRPAAAPPPATTAAGGPTPGHDGPRPHPRPRRPQRARRRLRPLTRPGAAATRAGQVAVSAGRL